MPAPSKGGAPLGVFAMLLLSGCATTDAMFASRDVPCDGDDCLPEPFVQFERGRPNVVVDTVGWVFGIPNRIFLWNWDVQNHDISIETEQQLQQYVAASGLSDVKVRLNQYDPGGEWQRLASNRQVGPGWRYTVGALTTLGYTILPGRLFGPDYYNPFTDTVHVYSDVPALGLQEAAYAKDVARRDLPGTYAFSQLIPGVSLVHETITAGDVLDYVDTAGDIELRKETVHVLYPRYGGSVGGAIGAYVPPAGSAFQIGGLLVGHVTGRWETRGWGTSPEAPQLSETAIEPTPTPVLRMNIPDPGETPLIATGDRLANPFEQPAATTPAGTGVIPASFDVPAQSPLGSETDQEEGADEEDAE